MPRKLDADDLVGTREIADRLGVGQSTVVQWRNRYDDFPAPVTQLHQTLIWSWEDIEAWAKANRRLP